MAVKLEIVMPGEKLEFAGVKSVVLQTTDGEVGILPGHLPMLVLVDVGLLRVATADGPLCFVTGQGVARVIDDHVNILLHDLIAEGDIREEDALRSYENLSKGIAAQAWMGGTEGHEERLRELRFAEAQLALAGLKPPL